LLDLSIDFAPALDHDDALQSWPIMTVLQPVDIVDGLVPADLGILEPIGLLLGDEDLDILAQRALTAFEREDKWALLSMIFLAMSR
jgi:hypothetical protein